MPPSPRHSPQDTHTVVLQPRRQIASRMAKNSLKQGRSVHSRGSPRGHPPPVRASHTGPSPQAPTTTYNYDQHTVQREGDLLVRFGIDTTFGRMVTRVLLFLMLFQPVYVALGMELEEPVTEAAVETSTEGSSAQSEGMGTVLPDGGDVAEQSKPETENVEPEDVVDESEPVTEDKVDADTESDKARDLELAEADSSVAEDSAVDEADVAEDTTAADDEATGAPASDDSEEADAASDSQTDSTDETSGTGVPSGEDDSVASSDAGADTTETDSSLGSGPEMDETSTGDVADTDPADAQSSSGSASGGGGGSSSGDDADSDTTATDPGSTGTDTGEEDTDDADAASADDQQEHGDGETSSSTATSTASTTAHTPGDRATSTDEVDGTEAISIAYDNTNKYTFGEGDCTLVADGEFYCVAEGPQTQVTGDPRVYAEKDREGDREIYYFDGIEVTRITNNSYDDFAPVFDEETKRIVWQAMINDRLQVMYHEIPTNTTRQVTTSRQNSSNPDIEGDIVVWQEWIETNWEVMVVDIDNGGGAFEPTQLTDNAVHDMFPQAYNGLITWQSERGTSWEVIVYDMRTKKKHTLEKNEDTKYENPRFVLLFDSKHENGDVETIGYDLDTGEMMELGTRARPIPEQPRTPRDEAPDALVREATTSAQTKIEGEADGTNG
jgi:beta propeller repeat protein